MIRVRHPLVSARWHPGFVAFLLVALVVSIFPLALSAGPSPMGRWIPTGQMAAARAGQTAGLLQDGRVLVVDSPCVEVYEPSTGQWRVSATLQLSSIDTVAVLPHGEALVWAGSQPSKPSLLNPFSGALRPAGDPSVARLGQTATVLQDGRVLVAGGTDGILATEVYDPANDRWTTVGNLNRPRYDHSAIVLSDGRVLILGGFTGESEAATTIEIFDPASGAWSEAESRVNNATAFSVSLLQDGRVIVVEPGAGPFYEAPLPEVEIYDPGNGSWARAASPSEFRQSGFTTTLLTDGRVLLAGGTASTGSRSSTTLDSSELYDPATDNWTAAPNMTARRSSHSATRLLDGKVLVAGGWSPVPPSGYFGWLATAELFDPQGTPTAPTETPSATPTYTPTPTGIPAQSTYLPLVVRGNTVGC